jgi:hypothetical protein
MNRLKVYNSFEDLPETYVAMFRVAGMASFFLSVPWFRNLAATVFEKDTLRIYGVESNCENPKAYFALPMCYQKLPDKFSPRRLTPVANYYSSLFGPVIDVFDCAQENLDLVAAAIATDRPRWDTVHLHPMDADNPTFNSILNAFRRAGMVADTYFCFGNWHLKVGDRSYHEYFESLPSKLKNTLKRKSKQLHDANRLRIEIISNDGHGDLQKAISAYETIYHSSWKKPEPYPSFIPSLIHTCATQGWLRMGLAYVDEKPAAAQIWIVSNGIASIYKLAYDEEFIKFSIGSILTARLMQHVIDIDRVREVDYLTGDDPYKRDWMSHRRERRGIIVFNLRTLRGTLAALRHMGGRAWNHISSAIHQKNLASEG